MNHSMETMTKFDTNEDSKYVSMYMNEACNKIESDLESTPLNGKVKKLYYGKEYYSQEDNMKQNSVDSNNTTPDDGIDNNQYYGELDLFMQESTSNDEDSELNQFPYRSRCNTWPRLQPQQPSNNFVISPASNEEKDASNIIEGSGSCHEVISGTESTGVNDISNRSVEPPNGSSSLLYGRLQGNTSLQQTLLPYSNRGAYSTSNDSPLTNQISGTYMLSHQSGQSISCVGGTERGNGAGNAPPAVRSPSVPSQDDQLLTSFTSSSLNSGPLPLLSEEDMVIDNDLMSFSKHNGTPGLVRVQKDRKEDGNSGEHHRNDLPINSSPPQSQRKLLLNADGESEGNYDRSILNNEKESLEASQCNAPGDKSAPLAISSLNNSPLSNLASSAGSCGANVSRRNAWGNLSYADLITQAIKSSPDQRLTLAQIYEWLVTNITHFREKSDNVSSLGWKNSIRHNLSLHSRFVRVQNEGTGKSSWWMLNPEALLPVNGHTRRSSGGGSNLSSNGSSTNSGNNLCSTNSSLLNANGGKNSRRRANTLDSTMSRTIDKRARGTNVKAVGNRRRGESGNSTCRVSSNGQQRKTELQRTASSGSLIMRDQNVGSLNGTMKCTAAQLTNSEGSTITSIASPLQYVQQQQHSPDFSVNGIRPRTSSNASSITGFEGDQFRDRSASNASSCGGAVGVNGHLSPPSLVDYPEQDSIHSGHLGSSCLPPFSSSAWTQNSYNGNDNSLINDAGSLNTANGMSMAPKSPLFNFDEKLSLNEKRIGNFDSYNPKEQLEMSNFGNSSNRVMVEGDDTTLEDIKLSDFDLDFDVWKTVIDETQEENVSSEDKFSSLDPKMTHTPSTVSQEQFTFKTEQGPVEDKCIKMEQTEMDVRCKNTEVGNLFPIIPGSFPGTPSVSAALHSYQQTFDSSNENLTQKNNFSSAQTQQFNAIQCSSGALPNETITHPQVNQKQIHRIKILEPRDINNGNSILHDSNLRIDNTIEGGNICHISSSSYSQNLTTKFRSNPQTCSVGPTAASALLFNTTASINAPNDINSQLQGGCHDSIVHTSPLTTSYQTSSWPNQSVANFRQQQQLQRNLLIFKQQKAAAAAQNQQQSFIRQQNNLSHKRVLYQTANYGFLKPIPPPPAPPPPPSPSSNKNGMVSYNVSTAPEILNQIQLNQFSSILQNNTTNSSELAKNQIRDSSGIQSGGNFRTDSRNNLIVANLDTRQIEYSDDSLEKLNGDTYLDPISGVLTINNSIEGEVAGRVDNNGAAVTNDVYNKSEIFESFNINDELQINDNYENIFNDFHGCHKSAQQHNITERLNFSDKYPQMNTGTISSSSSSSLNSPPSTSIMNMTSF